MNINPTISLVVDQGHMGALSRCTLKNVPYNSTNESRLIKNQTSSYSYCIIRSHKLAIVTVITDRDEDSSCFIMISLV